MGKNAIIVGASSGIGRGLAELLSEQGYRVGITGRREELLSEIKSTNPESYVVKVFDIDNYNDVKQHLDKLAAQLGDVDLFILSSGTGKRNPDLLLAHEELTFKTNVNGFTAAVNWAYKYFENRGGGSLAAISSVAGTRGFAMSPSYSASKSYQMTYLEALRQKALNSKSNICVTDIRPGFVDTAMGTGDGAFWIAPVSKSASQIITAIKKRKGVVYVTRRWFFVALFLRLIPNYIFERIKP
ncbi:MAG: SDR family NAD(P)-dependent oxidoreductase [Bacteroidales bacterium]|jgi:short-subunit dehydrogenase|nr:SDR family NAD(P)-dependent oxidoreductase [Bacteroidales bacterium]